MLIVPRNWESFQHYKDRAPPWIKLHKKLLDDFEFQCLPVASKALAPMLWLLASEHEKGHIDAASEKLAFRLRMTAQEVDDALKPLIDQRFFEVVGHVASKSIARLKRVAMPETEREAEKKPPCVPRFEEFWKTYPGPRKVGKAKCLETWLARGFTDLADEIILHVEAMKGSAQWKQEGGKFIPAPLTYLNQRRFEDGLPETPAVRLAI